MDQLFLYGNIVIGIIFIMIGFKVYNPYKDRDQEEEDKFYGKFGTLLKVGGILLVLLSIFKITSGLIPSEQWTAEDKTKMTEACIVIGSESVKDPVRVKDYCECTTRQTTQRLSKPTYEKYQTMPPSEFKDKLDPIVEHCNELLIEM